jgi:radical SAM superfamily enzyme YgiQ (UPF0313 family)
MLRYAKESIAEEELKTLRTAGLGMFYVGIETGNDTLLKKVTKGAIIFRANHASNVYSLGGILPDDKQNILSLIRNLKVRPELLKPKILRRF